MTEFNAVKKGNTINLYWITATENKCYGFNLEKYLFNSWTRIAFMRGHDLSNILNFYQYNDIKTISGFNIYRLKQIDTDVSFHYSERVKVYLLKNIVSKKILKQN